MTIKINKILKEWSKQTGQRKTQKDLADELNCTLMSLNNWNKGRNNVPFYIVKNIENLINKPHKYFVSV